MYKNSLILKLHYETLPEAFIDSEVSGGELNNSNWVFDTYEEAEIFGSTQIEEYPETFAGFAIQNVEDPELSTEPVTGSAPKSSRKKTVK